MDVSPSQPSDSHRTVHGVSSLLANLPSRGFLSSTVLSSNPLSVAEPNRIISLILDASKVDPPRLHGGGMRVYICEHDTSPPEGQTIKTNQQNILIRSLTLKKHKGDSSSRDANGAAPTDVARKRAADRAVDSRDTSKRAHSQTGSRQEGSNGGAPDKDFHSLTVDRLRALLKERGLSTKGRKDELVARLGNSAN